jgi:hypothetical protein
VDDSIQVWRRPEIVEWSQWLLDSYRHCVGRELMERVHGAEAQARALFTAPIVVVSHGMQDDPILNYGSQLALTLWEMTWEQLVHTPSRLTAEPVNRTERESMLERARTQGYIDNWAAVSDRAGSRVECGRSGGSSPGAGGDVLTLDLPLTAGIWARPRRRWRPIPKTWSWV